MTKSSLTDTQLVILAAAAQREDLRIELPERLRGGAAKAVLSTLLAQSLIELDPSLEHEHATPASESLGSTYRISINGLAAIGIESEVDDGRAQGHVDECAAGNNQTVVTTPAKAVASSTGRRPGTKLAEVISLLERADGASVDELTAITGWLGHTTRAALTGLRKRGVIIERAKRDDGTTFYRIAPTTSVETTGEVV